MTDEIVNSFWTRRLAWSRATERLARNVSRGRSLVLVLSCAGALLETVAATTLEGSPDIRAALAATGAVFLGISTYVAVQWLNSDTLRAWTVMRSVSEALKAEAFLFRTRCGRYSGPERVAQLIAAADAIELGACEYEDRLQPPPSGSTSAPGELDRHGYITERVIGQSEGYFRPAARRYARRARILRTAVVATGSVATVLSAAAAYLSTIGSNLDPAAWVAVLTTVSTAIAAHVSGQRYDFLILTYFSSARRLEALANEWRAAGDTMDEAAWQAFVQRCEEVIDTANQSWIAKLGRAGNG